MQKKERWSLLVLIAFVALCVLNRYPSLFVARGGRDNGSRSVTHLASDARAVPGARLTMLTHYLVCGHDEIEVHPCMPVAMVGLDEEGLRRAYPQWDVETITQDEVLLKKEVNSLCTDGRQHRFVTAQDGYITVFYGSQPPPAIVSRKTDIDITSLMPQDREAIEKGIVLTSDQEVLDLLEGLYE